MPFWKDMLVTRRVDEGLYRIWHIHTSWQLHMKLIGGTISVGIFVKFHARQCPFRLLHQTIYGIYGHCPPVSSENQLCPSWSHRFFLTWISQTQENNVHFEKWPVLIHCKKETHADASSFSQGKFRKNIQEENRDPSCRWCDIRLRWWNCLPK